MSFSIGRALGTAHTQVLRGFPQNIRLTAGTTFGSKIIDGVVFIQYGLNEAFLFVRKKSHCGHFTERPLCVTEATLQPTFTVFELPPTPASESGWDDHVTTGHAYAFRVIIVCIHKGQGGVLGGRAFFWSVHVFKAFVKVSLDSAVLSSGGRQLHTKACPLLVLKCVAHPQVLV